jgi:glucosamine--fructose-6-phosphate aminotransferase (isomerizing)
VTSKHNAHDSTPSTTSPQNGFSRPQDAFPHAMLREIFEQPDALARTLAHYAPTLRLSDVAFGNAAQIFRKHKDLVITASGSSRHAGLAAEIMLEDAAGCAVDVEYASEYITRSTNTKRNPAVLVISQSGETADTLAALREAMHRGHPTLAVTNVAGSSMAREATVSLPTLAGKEFAVPATKSFTTQVLVLRLLSLVAAEARETILPADLAAQMQLLGEIPARVSAQLPRWQQQAEALAATFCSAKTLLYLGRGIHYAIAREGALKLKESSYIHAEGYPAGELKHGPNALVSEATPLVVLATVDRNDAESVGRYEKTLSLLADMKQQGARSIVVANTGDEQARALATAVMEVDAADEYLLPLYEVIPLQLFAYYMAVANGVDVDRPRNLSKAVLVE